MNARSAPVAADGGVTVWSAAIAAPFVGWPAYLVSRGELRWELALAVFFGAVLPFLGPGARRLHGGILPVLLVGLLYDSMRFVKNVGITPERVHTCDLQRLDATLFGYRAADGPHTIHDYFQARPSLPLDVFFAIPYGVFLGAAVLFALFLYFRDYGKMQRFMWAFLAMNVAGFVTYHLYPAAPPWYVHQHGCVADLAARASEGPNLARVDAWLGFPYFRGFYGRSNDVFGAVPSLHVGYPVLIALEGWTAFRSSSKPVTWFWRAAASAFVLWMAGAAVYLDHHWVVDVALGVLYAACANLALRFVRVRKATPEAERAPLPAAGVS
ncbi:MAG TPA: phosphatase PAP2 family protein [Polyangiaceae bacterium]|nr:phosphatase PAP2 family protein [Polyangiaceae bacterium]